MVKWVHLLSLCVQCILMYMYSPRMSPLGLAKLVEASESVAKLSEELVVKEKELAIASEKAGRVLAEVAVKAQAAEKVKAEVQKVKDKAQALVDDIEADKSVATEKLEKAKPALEEAEAALQVSGPVAIAPILCVVDVLYVHFNVQVGVSLISSIPTC